MITKLTLTIDKTIIEEAKKYALEHGGSLSAIVENYLKALTASQKEDSTDEAPFSPVLQNLLGSIKLPPDFDYKKARENFLAEKYLSE